MGLDAAPSILLHPLKVNALRPFDWDGNTASISTNPLR